MALCVISWAIVVPTDFGRLRVYVESRGASEFGVVCLARFLAGHLLNLHLLHPLSCTDRT